MLNELPLYQRFPALRALPRATLCVLPSPVERITSFPLAPELWIKRDDLNSPLCGGNKARALEFLLGPVTSGDIILTLGGAGSTHTLATTLHARQLGAKTIAVRWRHEMNSAAGIVSDRLGRELSESTIVRTPVGAVLRSAYLRLTRTVHFIPIGGSTPLGALGHVNAGLELADQIRREELPMPRRIVLPLGSGGTMAGLALGLAIAGLDITLIGARVAPRIWANQRTVTRIARATSRLIGSLTGEALPHVRQQNLQIAQQVYGGAYGRPLAAAARPAAILESDLGILLDDTYSAKAFAAAIDLARAERGPTLFWLTFDARCLTS